VTKTLRAVVDDELCVGLEKPEASKACTEEEEEAEEEEEEELGVAKVGYILFPLPFWSFFAAFNLQKDKRQSRRK